MRKAVILVALVALVAGCGGKAEHHQSAPPAPPKPKLTPEQTYTQAGYRCVILDMTQYGEDASSASETCISAMGQKWGYSSQEYYWGQAGTMAALRCVLARGTDGC